MCTRTDHDGACEECARTDTWVDLLTQIRDRLPEPEGVNESIPAPTGDLPGELVEPGDLRAGDRVAFTWEGTGERIICTLASSLDGSMLRSDAPDRSDYYPYVTLRNREWCACISDVRLIERAPREDSDERIRVYVEMVERAEKAEAERDAYKRAKAENDERFQLEAAEQRERAEKAEAERDEFNGFWKDALADVRKARDERDEAIARAESERKARQGAEVRRALWQARHAALRADVEAQRDDLTPISGQPYTAILDRDDERTPQSDREPDATDARYEREDAEARQDDPDTVTLRRDAARDPHPDEHRVIRDEDGGIITRTPEPDADTVTLRRDDVEAVWEEARHSHQLPLDAATRVRAALVWGDEA